MLKMSQIINFMKTINFIAVFITVGLLTLSCSKTEEVGLQQSLESTLKTNVKRLSEAVNLISNSTDFQMLSQMNNESAQIQGINQAPENTVLKPSDTIDIKLADISGVFEYSWVKVKQKGNILRYFNRTGDSENMIVRLPVQKIKNPAMLFRYSVKDTTLTNNFEAVVSEYNLFRNMATGKEYRLTSAFNVDNKPLGSLMIHYTRNKINGYDYLSEYALASGYSIKYVENSGDTAICSRSISNQNSLLFEEKVTTMKILTENKKHRERTYSLSIGNVQIVRNQGKNSLDSARVYLDGVLQNNAKVEIVINNPDSTDQTIVNKKRDLKITYEDGTSTLISELTNATIDNIGLIFKSVRQATFATEIIDRIAWNIYSQK